jgi:hypothetical protein
MLLKTFAQMFAFSVVLFLCSASCFAQQETTPAPKQTITPEKRAAIAELLETMDVKKNALALINSMVEAEGKELPELTWEAISSNKEIQDLTPAEREDLKKTLRDNVIRDSQRIRDLIFKKIDLAALIEEISYTLYDKYYSEGEIKDLTAFYKSPTGRKTLEVMPNLISESMTSTITALKPKMAEIMTELRDEQVKRAQTELESKKPRKRTPALRSKPQ